MKKDPSSKQPPRCTDCSHYKDLSSFYSSQPVHTCGVEGRVDVVDGEKLYRLCAFLRKEGGICGVEGKFFKLLK